MKILITGSTGLLGQALVERLRPSCDVVGVSRHPSPVTGGDRHIVCDLTDADATARAIREVRPDVVVHAQVLSDVDRCEVEPELAERLNVWTTRHLCQALGDHGPLLIALSTDVVFDGSQMHPYDEADQPNPLNVYGKSKLAGERIVLGYPSGYVVRTSTLFGSGRMNFGNTIAQRASHGESIEAFVDQTSSPTYTSDLAESLQALIDALAGRGQPPCPRIYHMTNAGSCTRVEFAKRVVGLLGYPDSLIREIRMEDQHRPAPRPTYTALASRHLSSALRRTLRPWHEAVNAYLVSQGWLS